MSQDTADYDHLSHAAAPGSRRGGGAKVAEGLAAGSPNGAAADEEAGTPEWVLGNGAGTAVVAVYLYLLSGVAACWPAKPDICMQSGKRLS